MGEPTHEERGVPHVAVLEDPAFLDWARRQGKPVTRVTPYAELMELAAQYELEKREGRRREQERARSPAAAPVLRSLPVPRVAANPFVQSQQQGRADARLRERIRALWLQGSSSLRTIAEQEVNRLSHFSRLLYGSRFDEERERWTFLRHYFWMANVAFGDRELGEEELLDAVLAEEKAYRIEIERRAAAFEKASRPRRQLSDLRQWAKKQPMNPADAFEPGIAYYNVGSARSKPDWMENGAVAIEHEEGVVIVKYARGKPLQFPRMSIDFDGNYAAAIEELIVRRHKASGRLVPFAIYERGVDLLKDLPEIDEVPERERVLMALPRFDANLTPLILADYSPQAFQLRLARGLLGVTALLTLQKGVPLGASAATTVLSATTRGLTTGVSVGRAVAQEVVLAVRTYGFSSYAAAHLGRTAYYYYLVNAVAINTGTIIGAEVILSLGGHDMGPMSQGDMITMASQTDDIARGTRSTWNAIRVQVDRVDPRTGRAVAVVRSIAPISDDIARTEYEFGKKVVGEVSITGRAARGVADTATDARTFARPTAPTPDVPDGKRATRLAADPRPSFPIADYEAARVNVARGLDRLARGTKYDPKALETIRNLTADAIRESGISAADFAKLANSLSHAGEVTRKFINEFFVVPGFDRVLLTWVRKHVWDARRKVWKKAPGFSAGSSYVMRYATARLDPKHVRFEWPVSINDTKWGEEVFARHVDIVVAGGDVVKPGQQIQLELKSWTDYYLQKKANSARGGIGYQLIRDTALFSPDNIRWVFDGKKVNRAAVLKAFEKVIEEDPYLRLRWGGEKADPAQIRALLEKVIEIF